MVGRERDTFRRVYWGCFWGRPGELVALRPRDACMRPLGRPKGHSVAFVARAVFPRSGTRWRVHASLAARRAPLIAVWWLPQYGFGVIFGPDVSQSTVTAGSWPDWLAAIGTSAAFIVAAIAYGRDVRARRWAQARLVYVRMKDLSWHGPGATVPLLAHGAGSGRGDVPWVPVRTNQPPTTHQILLGPGGVVTAAVHNGSDELIGPAFVRAIGRTGLDVPWDFEAIAGPVDPHSDGVVELVCSNPHFPGGEPNVQLEVTFRDSAGRWWRRRGHEPVERARDRERQARKARRERARARRQGPAAA